MRALILSAVILATAGPALSQDSTRQTITRENPTLQRAPQTLQPLQQTETPLQRTETPPVQSQTPTRQLETAPQRSIRPPQRGVIVAQEPAAADAPRVLPVETTLSEDRIQSLMQAVAATDLQWYQPAATDLTVARPGAVLQMDALESGALIPLGSLSSALPKAELDGLALGGRNALDLQALGITGTPSGPVNPFALYDKDGQFGGIVTPPAGVTSEAFIRSAARKGQRARPIVALSGDRDVSTLNHKILTVLTDFCAAAIRPVEFSVQASGGWDLGFEAKAQVSAKIDVDRSCAVLETELADVPETETETGETE
ncbi:hypothetical protein KUH32_02225 [Thalassococcus sp. CAU 1522]|uniref:Uncharacterized protein n=1 Tax=Thalassococcus arenae TaxID=2851652 RepID=A0ABS6N4J4_9RHOB|nr:hypothetical protein [Thalassococcus arenae]MBV2358577.1 hypothetical protein [Thalassococcus arenae]